MGFVLRSCLCRRKRNPTKNARRPPPPKKNKTKTSATHEKHKTKNPTLPPTTNPTATASCSPAAPAPTASSPSGWPTSACSTATSTRARSTVSRRHSPCCALLTVPHTSPRPPPARLLPLNAVCKTYPLIKPTTHKTHHPHKTHRPPQKTHPPPRPHARAALPAGRRAHLLPTRAGGGRGAGVFAHAGRGVRDVWAGVLAGAVDAARGVSSFCCWWCCFLWVRFRGGFLFSSLRRALCFFMQRLLTPAAAFPLAPRGNIHKQVPGRARDVGQGRAGAHGRPQRERARVDAQPRG